MKKNPNIEAVFFDLDGTLIDTAPDLYLACNKILKKFNRPSIAFENFRQWVHGGSLMMICNSFQIKEDHHQFKDFKQEFLDEYHRNIIHHSKIFKGVEKVLNYLERMLIPWGIVTNKLKYLTEPLLNYFNLSSRSCCLVCVDTLNIAKPDPAPLLHACKLTSSKPEHSVYVGDTYGDIQAAKSANMRSIAVYYGYLPGSCNPLEWNAHAGVQKPEEIIKVLKNWLVDPTKG